MDKPSAALLSVVLLFISGDIHKSQAQEKIAGCPDVLPHTDLLALYGSKCYQFVHDEVEWVEARSFCNDHEGDMLRLDNRDLSEFIRNQLREIKWKTDVWIGLNDREDEGEWHWENRTSTEDRARWTQWAKGHPSKGFILGLRDCVRMDRGDSYRWHDTLCDSPLFQYRFICEYNYNPPIQPIEPNLRSNESSAAERQTSVTDETVDHTAMYVGVGVAGALLLLALIVVIVLLVLARRNRNKKATNSSVQTSSAAVAFDNRTYERDVIQNEYSVTGRRQLGEGEATRADDTYSPPPSYTSAIHENIQNGYAESLPTKQPI